MKRRLWVVAFLLSACTLLSACDKCTGGWQQIQYPGQPKSCADREAR
ncbi:MAG: hypothetical protein WAK03_10805 [Methylocystis sp.]|jgi:predicted small secreted protein